MRGGLLVRPLSESIRSVRPESPVLLGEGRRPHRIASIRPHRSSYLVYLHGCVDRDAAEAFRGAEVLLRLEHADPLPEGVYYHWQILGLQAVTEDGQRLGEVAEILETGANDVYVLRDPAGGEILLPALRSVVLHVDQERQLLRVRLPPGLVDPD